MQITLTLKKQNNLWLDAVRKLF